MERLRNNSSSSKREFTVTYTGQGSGEYRVGQRLSFSPESNDDEIGHGVNMDSGLQFLNLGYTGRNKEGELCFATGMDGINFGEVLRIKEVA